MNQQAIDTLKAERDELRKRAAWYEELRQATDGGSESMTHENAIEHVLALAAENKVLREAVQAFIDYDNCDESDISDVDLLLKYNEALTLARAALTKEATK